MKQRKIIKSSIVVVLLIIFGKALAIFRDALMFSKFGASRVSDIYFWSLSVVYIFTSIGYGLSNTIIPMITEYNEKNSMDERNRFVNNVITVSTLCSLVICLICIVFGGSIINLFAHSFTKDIVVYSEAIKILRIMLLSILFLNVQGIVAGILQAHKEFLIPSAMAAVSNFVYIIYLVFFVDRFGITGFAVATVIAFFTQFIINVPKFKMLKYKYKYVFDLKDDRLIKLFILMIPIIISISSIQINLFVNKSFAGALYEGAVGILESSNKLTMLTYEVFAVAISMVAYPMLSTFAANKKNDQFKEALKKTINLMIFIMIPAAFGIAALRIPLISMLYERGKFSYKDVELSAAALIFYSPAMIAYGVKDILNRAYYSLKDTKTPMIYSIVGIAINAILSFILYRKMLVPGLTISAAVSAAVITIMLCISLNKKLDGFGIKEILRNSFKIIISSIIMFITIIGVKDILMNKLKNSFTSNFIIIICCFFVGIIIYFLMSYLLKLDQLEELKKLLKNKLNK